MNDLKNKVAVVTGAASGIGLSIAEQCVSEGIKVVIADINEKILTRCERRLKKKGGDILAVVTDVSKAKAVEILAQKTLNAFDEVHLLFNNAGVGMPGLTWEYSLEDWEWILGVNLWGVIHGLKYFIPIMLKQENECYVVNISSLEGLIPGFLGGSPYGVTKAGVICLSQNLRIDLEKLNSKIKVSVVCPGLVNTKIFSSWMRKPAEYQNDSERDILDIKYDEKIDIYREIMKESPGIPPEDVAAAIFKGIKQEKFVIFSHTQRSVKEMIKERMDEILNAFDN